jgi:hypothetical protein
MMPADETIQTVLQHCDNRCVYPVTSGDPPLSGPLNVSVGGATGDGHVAVTTNPPSPPTSVDTNELGVIPGPVVREIYMHYFAKPGAPTTVEVSVSQPGP